MLMADAIVTVEMAFFNLAHLGPQDPIQARLKASNSSQPPDKGHKSETPTDSSQQARGASRDESPPTCTTGHRIVEPSAPTSDASTTTTQSCAKKTPWHKGSHVKYTDLLRKHQRNPEGPKELYTSPVTTQQEYGWWSKDDCKPQPWTHTDKHPLVNSEMTRFVDEMSLTDKEFSLY